MISNGLFCVGGLLLAVGFWWVSPALTLILIGGGMVACGLFIEKVKNDLANTNGLERSSNAS